MSDKKKNSKPQRVQCTKNEAFIKDFFSKYFQIQRKLRIWSHSTVKAKIRILLAYFLNILSFFHLGAYLEPCQQTFVISLLCANIAVSYFRQKHCVKSVCILSYSVQMRENADQNNSEYDHICQVNQWSGFYMIETIS